MLLKQLNILLYFFDKKTEEKGSLESAEDRMMNTTTASNTLTTTEAATQPTESTDRSFWIVTFLVSGTCIGGGMLALPVQTATSGFVYSFFALVLCWGFMTYTGLLLAEATMWIKNETHFTSLSRILVGDWMRLLAAGVYLFMNYLSLVAYTAGGAALFQHYIASFTGLQLGYEQCCVLFTLIFGSMIYLGAFMVGKINFLFMVGLGICYFFLAGLSASYVEVARYQYFPYWREAMGIFSIILATFSYQMVVPSICLQLNYQADKIKKAIIFGTTIPFVIYTLWLMVIHGVVPIGGENGLLNALERGASATEPLRAQFDHWSLSALSDLFALCAVVTSYLGLSLALFYFLKDCFHEIKFDLSKNMIIVASIVPTLFLAMMYPKALVHCLDLSGAYGDTILSGMIPVTMVWIGRYKKNYTGEFRIPGGKPALVLAAGFYFYIFAWQLIAG